MKSTRIIATILFYLTKIVAGGYLLTSIYIFVSSGLKLSTFKSLDNNRFAINYPFTDKNFLLGSENTIQYIAEMVISIGFYGVFFYLLSTIFYTFKQQRLFTIQGVRNLKIFYVFNLFITPIVLGILATISIEDLPYIGLIVAHFTIGIFALFLEAIFRQGANLQNEQDLFI